VRLRKGRPSYRKVERKATGGTRKEITKNVLMEGGSFYSGRKEEMSSNCDSAGREGEEQGAEERKNAGVLG